MDVIYWDENSEVTRGDLSASNYTMEMKKVFTVNKNVYDCIRKWMILEMSAMATKDTNIDWIQHVVKDASFKIDKDGKENFRMLRNPDDLSKFIQEAINNDIKDIDIITECSTIIASKYFVGNNFNELYNFEQRQDIDDDNDPNKNQNSHSNNKNKHHNESEDDDIDINYNINNLPIKVSYQFKTATNASEHLTAEEVNTPMD